MAWTTRAGAGAACCALRGRGSGPGVAVGRRLVRAVPERGTSVVRSRAGRGGGGDGQRQDGGLQPRARAGRGRGVILRKTGSKGVTGRYETRRARPVRLAPRRPSRPPRPPPPSLPAPPPRWAPLASRSSPASPAGSRPSCCLRSPSARSSPSLSSRRCVACCPALTSLPFPAHQPLSGRARQGGSVRAPSSAADGLSSCARLIETAVRTRG